MLGYMRNQVAIIEEVGWVTPEIIEIDIPQNELCPLVSHAFEELAFILMIGDRDDVDRFAPQLSSQIRRHLKNRHLNQLNF